MQELIDIIVNILSKTDEGGRVQITRKSASAFIFEGDGIDMNGTAYDYSITCEFKSKEQNNKTEK